MSELASGQVRHVQETPLCGRGRPASSAVKKQSLTGSSGLGRLSDIQMDDTLSNVLLLIELVLYQLRPGSVYGCV